MGKNKLLYTILQWRLDMRPVWKGAISFGLVNIPVDLITAESRNDLKFNMIDSRDHNRIRYERVNEETGEEVPWDQIVKAYEFSDDNYVIVTDEDFDKADLKATKTIDIETFINREELGLIYLEKPYYIQTKKGGEKAYSLLRDALKETEKIAIARVVIRTKSYLGAIYPSEDMLILNLIRFHQELKPAEDIKVPGDIKVTKKEMDLAIKLIEDMSEKWQPELYKDEYRLALMERIKAKAKGKEIVEETDDDEEESNVIDIMDLLKKSVESKKKNTPKKESKNKRKTS